jgi:hypothetical protein
MAIFSLAGYSTVCGDVPTKRQTSHMTSTSLQDRHHPQHLQHPHRRDVGTLCIASETHKAKVTYKYYKGFFQQKTTEKSPEKQKKKIFFCGKRRKAA